MELYSHRDVKSMWLYIQGILWFKKNQRCDLKGPKSRIPGHEEIYQFIVTLHVQKVGEIGWDSHVAHHSWIITLIPIWHHTEVLSLPVCQLHFCMHEYWYDIRGWKNVRRQLWLLCLCWFPRVCKVCKCMHVTSFWKIYSQTYPYACMHTHTYTFDFRHSLIV